MLVTDPVDPDMVCRDPQAIDRMSRDALIWRQGRLVAPSWKTFVVGSLVVKVQVPAVTDVKGHGPCCPWQLTFKATGLAFWRRSYRSNQGPAQANVLSFVLKRHEMSTQIRSNQHESGFTTSLGFCNIYIIYISCSWPGRCNQLRLKNNSMSHCICWNLLFNFCAVSPYRLPDMIEQTPEAFSCPALILHGSSDKLYSAQGAFALVAKLVCDIWHCVISSLLLFEGKC